MPQGVAQGDAGEMYLGSLRHDHHLQLRSKFDNALLSNNIKALVRLSACLPQAFMLCICAGIMAAADVNSQIPLCMHAYVSSKLHLHSNSPSDYGVQSELLTGHQDMF